MSKCATRWRNEGRKSLEVRTFVITDRGWVWGKVWVRMHAVAYVCARACGCACSWERAYLLLGLCARLLLLGEHHLPLGCDLNAFSERFLQLLDALLLMTERVLRCKRMEEKTKCNVSIWWGRSSREYKNCLRIAFKKNGSCVLHSCLLLPTTKWAQLRSHMKLFLIKWLHQLLTNCPKWDLFFFLPANWLSWLNRRWMNNYREQGGEGEDITVSTDNIQNITSTCGRQGSNITRRLTMQTEMDFNSKLLIVLN